MKRQKKRARHQGAVTAIELEGRVLRVVQAAPKITKVAIARITTKTLDLPEDASIQSPEMVGKAIRKTLDSLQVSGPVVMGISRNQVVLRTLTLPEIKNVSELASVVHFQIAKELPFRLEESVIDFSVHRTVKIMAAVNAPQGKASKPAGEKPADIDKCEVLVAAVKKEIVDYYLKIAAAAGVKLAALGLQAYANVCGLEAFSQNVNEGAIALISLRHDEVLIDIIDRQALLFSRGAGIQAAGDRMEATGIEIIRSLNGYEGMQTRTPVKKVLITGDTGIEAKIAAFLGKRINLPCSVLDLDSSSIMPESSAGQAAGALSAIGLAFGVYDTHGLSFDFLNPKNPAPPRNVRRMQIIIGTVLAAACLALLFAVRTRLVEGKMQVYRQMSSQITLEEKKRILYKTVRAQELAVKNWMKDTQNWLDHYAYLSALLPSSEEVYLTLLSVSGQGAIHMGVQAKSGETLAKVEKQLRAAGYSVKPLAVNPGSDKFGYSFRSNIELIAPEKMKIDLAKVQAPERPADDSSLQGGKRGLAPKAERQRVEAPPPKNEPPAAVQKPPPQAAYPAKPVPQGIPEKSARNTTIQNNRQSYPGAFNRDGTSGRTVRKRGAE